MVNRVLLNASALSISAPGVDVFSALEKDLIFSSNYMSARRFLTGSVVVGANSQAVVYYGATLNGYPVGVFYTSLNAWIGRHPIIQATTQVQTDQKEFTAQFGLSSVTFLNRTAANATFLYAVIVV